MLIALLILITPMHPLAEKKIGRPHKKSYHKVLRKRHSVSKHTNRVSKAFRAPLASQAIGLTNVLHGKFRSKPQAALQSVGQLGSTKSAKHNNNHSLRDDNKNIELPRFIKVMGGISQATGRLSSEHDRKFQPAAIIIGSFGAKLHRKFSAHVSVAYRPWHRYSYKDASLDIPEKHSLSDLSFTVNGSFILYNGEVFEPYIMAGGGIAFNQSGDFRGGVLIPSEYSSGKPYTEVLIGKLKQSLMWAVGLGTVIKFSKNVGLDLVYLYSDLGKYVTSGAVTLGPTANGKNYGVTLPIRGRQKTHSILAGIVFWF